MIDYTKSIQTRGGSKAVLDGSGDPSGFSAIIDEDGKRVRRAYFRDGQPYSPLVGLCGYIVNGEIKDV